MSESLMYGQKNIVCAEIHSQLKANKTLLKFLHYMTNDVDIPNAKPLTKDEAIKISKENIFIEDKIPADLSPVVKCYICMSYGQKIYHEQKNQFYNGNTFIINVICHKDIRNCLNGDRVYCIEECIRETFENGRIGATGSTRLQNSVPLGVKDGYSGVGIQIVFNDFNGGK